MYKIILINKISGFEVDSYNVYDCKNKAEAKKRFKDRMYFHGMNVNKYKIVVE